jgi:glycosyltransferase involved in cell wall biosynthesis
MFFLRRIWVRGNALRIVMVSGLDMYNLYGQSTRPYYLNKVLSRIGAKILHICPHPPQEGIANTSFVSIRVGAGSYVKIITKIIAASKILAQAYVFHPDVLYVHQLGWMKVLGIRLSRLLRRPLVFDIHGSVTQEMEANRRDSLDRLADIEQAEAEALAAADGVIVVSRELMLFLRTRFGVPEDSMMLVPNGVDLESYEGAARGRELQKMRERLHIPYANRVVTFTCPRLEHFLSNEIALEWFFDVVRILDLRRNDLTFLILGGGEIVPVPSSSVLYPGYVEDLPSVLALSDVCVLPYPADALCGGVRNKALDYFAAGKPVVSTTEGMRGIQEAVAGRNYLLADSTEEFAEGILQLLSDERLALTIGSGGMVIAKQYDWSFMGQRVYGILSSLASRKDSGMVLAKDVQRIL